MACKNRNEVLRELRENGSTAEGLKAVRDVLDVLQRAEVKDLRNDKVGKLEKGAELYHVSDARFDKFAVAGDVIDGDWEVNTVGAHVGSKDTVEEYKKQMFDEDANLYKVKVNDDMTTLEMVDVGDSNWTADNMYDQLVDIYGEVPFNKEAKATEVRDFLVGKKVDAIKYKNTEENGGWSYMVVNPDKVDLEIVEDKKPTDGQDVAEAGSDTIEDIQKEALDAIPDEDCK
jgi:hypothetical protein